MYAFKDKVSEKLSRLFPESSNSSSSSSSSNDREPKASSYSNGVKSLSSYFSYIIPTKGLDESGPKSHHNDYNIVPSEPVRNKKQNPKCRVEISDSHEMSSGSEGERQTESNVDEKPNNSPPNPLSNLMDESAFISAELYEFLFSSIPNIVKGCRWILLYSTLRHGISLRTLIRKSADLSGPCLLIVGDKQGAVFGGLLECPLKPTPKRKYQGTNQSFVFTTIYGQPRLFRATGANRYYYLCLDNLLALGGGGNFALCLDGDLLNGTSGPCETFGNVCLAHKPEFELKNVELWGFTHASQYLT